VLPPQNAKEINDCLATILKPIKDFWKCFWTNWNRKTQSLLSMLGWDGSVTVNLWIECRKYMMKSRLFLSTNITTIYHLTCSLTVSELLCSSFDHLNCMNLKLWGRGNTTVQLYSAITAFQKKLQFLLSQTAEYSIIFLNLTMFSWQAKLCPKHVPKIIRNVIEKFGQIFDFLQNHVPRFNFMTIPMTYPLKDLSKNVPSAKMQQ
jgi:hypothetical protein